MVGSSTFGAPQKLQSAAVVGKMAAYQKMAAMFHACILTMQICRRYCMSSIYPCSIVQETAKASRIWRWEEERKRCKTKRKTSCWIPSLVMHLQGVLWNLNDAGPLKTVSINSRNLEQNYLVNLLMLFSNVRNDVIWSLIWRRGERYTWLRRRKQQPRSAPRHAALVLLRRAKSFNIVNRMGTEEVETRKRMCLICPGIDTWTFLEGKKPKTADESADAGLTMQYWGLFVVCCLSFAPGFGGHFGELKEVAKTERQLNRKGLMAGGGFTMFQKCKSWHWSKKWERVDGCSQRWFGESAEVHERENEPISTTRSTSIFKIL